MGIYMVRSGGAAYGNSITKSLWLLNPVSEGIKIVQLAVSFDAAAVGQGISVELYRVTTIGSATGSAFTPVRIDGVSDIAAATTTAVIVLGTEPTASDILAEWTLQPFGGFMDIQYPMGREPFAAPAGQRIGLRCITPAVASCNARSYVWFEE